MINAATVGVHDHKTHMPMPPESSRILITKAAPVAITSTSTEKMAAWLVSVSFVNITQIPSPAASSTGRSCLVATPADLGGGQVAVLHLHVALLSRPRNSCTILPRMDQRIPQMSDVFTSPHRLESSGAYRRTDTWV